MFVESPMICRSIIPVSVSNRYKCFLGVVCGHEVFLDCFNACETECCFLLLIIVQPCVPFIVIKPRRQKRSGVLFVTKIFWISWLEWFSVVGYHEWFIRCRRLFSMLTLGCSCADVIISDVDDSPGSPTIVCCATDEIYLST